MKKLGVLFILLSLTTFANDGEEKFNEVSQIEEGVATFDKSVEGINKEKLEYREIKSEIELERQKIDTSEIKIQGESFKNDPQKVKVVEGDKKILEEELSQGVEKKSYLKYILGGLGVIALIIAL